MTCNKTKTKKTRNRLKKAIKLRMYKDKKVPFMFDGTFELISDQELEFVNIFECDTCTSCHGAKRIFCNVHGKLCLC